MRDKPRLPSQPSRGMDHACAGKGCRYTGCEAAALGAANDRAQRARNKAGTAYHAANPDPCMGMSCPCEDNWREYLR